MTSTNQAFISAYRQSVAAPGREASSPSAPWANIEIATWQVGDDSLPAAPLADDAPRLRVDPPHHELADAESAQSRRMRRRLSDIAAERERFESKLQQPPATTATATATIEPVSRTSSAAAVWPELCAELLAVAAPAYDAALKSLAPPDGTSTLIGVVASQPASGCTTTAICLALRAATLGLRPMLFEAAGNTLAGLLQITASGGWMALAQRGESPLRAVHFDARSGAAILPCGDESGLALAPSQLFELATAAGVLRHKHRVVIVDLGPLDTPRHATQVTSLVSAMGVDSLLAVTRNAQQSLDELRRQLGPHSAKLIGAIANGN